MSETALLLTGGHLATSNAKTAHGLVRGPSRFRLVGVVDPVSAGRDAGEVVDGKTRGIPCFATLEEALTRLDALPDRLVVGVAVHGGKMPAEIRSQILAGVKRGIGAVNGLHELLHDDPEIVAAAGKSGATLHDIRRPKRFSELRSWHGEAVKLSVPRVAVLGTDCALGKRTTATFLLEGMRARGLSTELVTTGQTGWLQGHRFGFVLDATPNDFVTGELERAVVACATEAKPDLILLEGQSALRNPSGPCGAELLLSAGARGVVLQHAPGRKFFDDTDELGLAIPSVESEVELLERFFGATVLGISLNGEHLSEVALRAEAARIADSTGRPVAMPLLDRCEPLLEPVERFARAGRP